MSNVPNYQDALNQRYVIDLVERVAWTFVQAFGAQLVASGWFTVDAVTDLSIVEKAAISGLAAILSLVKGLVAKGVGSSNTAATLPAQDDTPRP